jgi:hypothetical protein
LVADLAAGLAALDLAAGGMGPMWAVSRVESMRRR